MEKIGIRESVPMYWFPDRNFGDALAPVLVREFTNSRVFHQPCKDRARLFGSGSILAQAAKGDVIWGTGTINDRQLALDPRTAVFALRGPLTAKAAGIKTDIAFGDPVQLVSAIMDSTASRTTQPLICIVPHYKDFDRICAQLPPADDLVVVDPRGGYRHVLETISAASVVISSSLHGIVASESFSVPAIWMKPGAEVVGGEHKFRDYFLGTGRRPPAAESLRRALEIAYAADIEPPALRTLALREALDDSVAEIRMRLQ